MSEPREVVRAGNEWVVTWPGVRLIFNHVAPSHGELKAQVRVEYSSPNGWQYGAGPTMVNLVSIEGQKRTGDALTKRTGGETPWFDLVATACAIVHFQWSQPPPAVGAQVAAARASGPIDWVLPGLILAGETSMLYGDGASAKSMLALLIAICVALGIELPWGVRPTRRLKVLYTDWETNDVVFGRRLRRLCSGLEVPVPQDDELVYMGTIVGDPNVAVLGPLADEVDTLRTYISRERIGMVIADSVGFMINGKLSDDDVARQAMNNLRMLGGGVTRLAVHHVSRDSALRQTTGRVDPFGSIYFRNGARSGFEVRKSDEHTTRDEIQLGLFQHKANDGELSHPFALRVHFGPDAIRFERSDFGTAPDLGQRAPLQQQILEILDRHGESTAQRIAFLLGRADRAGEESVRTTLGKLLKAGQVRQARMGLPGNPATWILAPVTDVPEPFRNALDDFLSEPEDDRD